MADDDPALLKELYEHAPCGYLCSLADGTIITVNETFLTWTGHRREALLRGVRFQELLTIGDRIFYETHYAPLTLPRGGVSEIAVDLLCSDRERLPVLVSSSFNEAAGELPATIRTCVFRATQRREYELLRARQRAEESEARVRLLARTLQQSLIPPALPRIPGLDVAAAYRPAGRGDEVGGDFYDLFETSPDDWGLVLGDVCGKGAEAAVVTSLARHTVRAHAAEVKEPAAVLRELNTALVRQRADRFCTVVYTRVHRDRPGVFSLTVSLGGHPQPLRVRANGEVTPIGCPGTVLGLFDDVTVCDETVELAPGDAVLLFTDGVTEARDGTDLFDEHRLTSLLAGARALDAQGIADRIVEAVLAFQDGLSSDDIALFVLKAPLTAPAGAARP
ncbi:SpoIIE family protein phosphatase [Nonomuraea sp. NPDC048916]|uniref:PP2C family protein-serine/threonine phosphatase n=1 Tax=Nonomuraea sp. NPDC048916 TaxID=3154232 RepID=UPI0033F1067C